MYLKKKLTYVSLALAGCVASTSTQAATSRDGFNACVDALVSSMATAQSAPLRATISEDSIISDDRLRYRDRIYLDARDPVTREVVAKANCIVNRNAEVVEFKHLPDDAPEAEVRSL